jgi:hypothetical protein
MACPPEVTNAILQILKIGIINIRGFASSKNMSRCAAEADHLHNLPELLTSYTPELFRFYLEVEQPLFLKITGGEGVGQFEPHWAILKAFGGTRRG